MERVRRGRARRPSCVGRAWGEWEIVWSECGEIVERVWGECEESVGRVWGESGKNMWGVHLGRARRPTCPRS